MIIAFLPAAILGVVLHGFIKGVLFNPLIVCIALILGGFVLLIVDNLPLAPRLHGRDAVPAVHVRQDRHRPVRWP